MNNKNFLKIVSLVVLTIFAAGSLAFPSLTTEFSKEKAKLVDLTLKRIAKNKKRRSPFLRKISFSQNELNSYLNLIYAKQYTPEVKYIKLKLEKDNFVSGTVKVKLEGKQYAKVPNFLKDIEVETAGKIECNNYRMRFMFETLRVNGTSFSPEVLDEAFSTAQSGFKVKKSLYDWFSLLPGIKNIVIEYKKITIFY
jgi:hypothetical protein